MDIEQVAMQINAARKTSRRSCCSVTQAYTRSIAQPCSVRIVVGARQPPDSGNCLDKDRTSGQHPGASPGSPRKCVTRRLGFDVPKSASFTLLPNLSAAGPL